MNYYAQVIFPSTCVVAQKHPSKHPSILLSHSLSTKILKLIQSFERVNSTEMYMKLLFSVIWLCYNSCSKTSRWTSWTECVADEKIIDQCCFHGGESREVRVKLTNISCPKRRTFYTGAFTLSNSSEWHLIVLFLSFLVILHVRSVFKLKLVFFAFFFKSRSSSEKSPLLTNCAMND